MEELMGDLAKYEPSDTNRIKKWSVAGATALEIRHRLVRLHDQEDDYTPPGIDEIEKIIKGTNLEA